jgi:putative flavoprotein involved in K+ transport
MATYQKPRVPAIAKDLDPDIVQVHSRDYRNPGQLKPGGVLVVGAGNSGADIAVEVAKTHETWLAGRDVGHVPFRIESAVAKVLIPVLFRLVFHRVLTVATPLGRRARRAPEHGGALIRVKPADLEAAHVHRIGRFTAVRNGRPVLEDGQALDVANVIWSTGFEPGLSWIDIPLPQFHGAPAHDRGIMPDEPGLYFVGQFFLYAFSSTMIHGVERDARRVAKTIHTRLQSTAAVSLPSRSKAFTT